MMQPVKACRNLIESMAEYLTGQELTWVIGLPAVVMMVIGMVAAWRTGRRLAPTVIVLYLVATVLATGEWAIRERYKGQLKQRGGPTLFDDEMDLGDLTVIVPTRGINRESGDLHRTAFAQKLQQVARLVGKPDPSWHQLPRGLSPGVQSDGVAVPIL